MHMDWTSLNQRERADFSVLRAFLANRLASIDTVHWALDIKTDEKIKRIAIIDLMDSAVGRKLGEPWQSAWRLIEEVWDSPGFGHFSDSRPYDIADRIRGGDRSGSLVSAIAECVAPRLTVSRPSPSSMGGANVRGKLRTVSQLVSARLDSGKVVDPSVMALNEIDDDAFLTALANALESKLIRGLDCAKRIGWDGETRLYKLGQLHRVAYVPETERKQDDHEPDEFHQGIAPCVKLLHFVVERLAMRQAPTARGIVERWSLTQTPIHLRLWAALARDSWVCGDVGQALLSLGDRQFWDVQNYPEIAELRAHRFLGLAPEIQNALIKRLRKTPPRSHWTRNADSATVARARSFSATREFRRIENAGAVLSGSDRMWLDRQLERFPELVAVTGIDDGFLRTPAATWVAPQPDALYDGLAGETRLAALEAALGVKPNGWRDDESAGAQDWIQEPGNASRLISDFESCADGGAAYPKVWERFGWAHLRAVEPAIPKPASEVKIEVTRTLNLLAAIPVSSASDAIEGLSHWLSVGSALAVQSPEGLKVWGKLWPIAVTATNAAQPVNQPISLNLVATTSADREPMDLDTLNTPTGNLVGVFLEACGAHIGKGDPFDVGQPLREMRDIIIAASGRSGLIVRHRLIEHLPYFLHVDALWTRQHLISALLSDDASAMILWRALARRTQFVDVLKIIGDAVAKRATDPRLGRETRKSLVFSLVVECLHGLFEGREPAVPYAVVQQMLRALDDELRAHAVNAVQRFARDMSSPRIGAETLLPAEDLFDRAVAPFLRAVWPQDRSYCTPGVSKGLADLPATTRGAFARAVDAIERFLVPFDAWSLLDYGFFGDEGGEPKLAKIDSPEKASALLRLLDATIGVGMSAVVPFDLASALAKIEDVSSVLAQDQRFRRLAAAARR